MIAAQYTEATLEREDWALGLRHTLVKTNSLMNHKEFLMGSHAFKKVFFFGNKPVYRVYKKQT